MMIWDVKRWIRAGERKEESARKRSDEGVYQDWIEAKKEVDRLGLEVRKRRREAGDRKSVV